MSKRKRKTPKTNKFTVMTSEEATLAKMPRYNGFAGGYGAHGDTKYNRAKESRNFKREMLGY